MLDVIGQLIASAGTALFGRVAPQDLLEQPLRRRLLTLIQDRPGIHASELCREAGEPWGTVQYHLSLLHRSEMVTAVEAGRERHFFPSQVDPEHARLLAILHQGRRHEIAAFIRAHPGSRQVDICEAIEVSRKTFRSSIEPLVAEGLVHERRGLQNNRYFPQDGLVELLGPEPASGVPELADAATAPEQPPLA
jgi:predicted transcriptional regulator